MIFKYFSDVGFIVKLDVVVSLEYIDAIVPRNYTKFMHWGRKLSANKVNNLIRNVGVFTGHGKVIDLAQK